jgi:hypothetical protein
MKKSELTHIIKESYKEILLEDSFSVKLNKFISKFPDNATSWADATDEIRDMASKVRQYYNEYVLDVNQDDPTALKPLNFKQFTTPSEWNTKGKQYIIDTFNKLTPDGKKDYFEYFSGWLKEHSKKLELKHLIKEQIRSILKETIGKYVSFWGTQIKETDKAILIKTKFTNYSEDLKQSQKQLDTFGNEDTLYGWNSDDIIEHEIWIAKSNIIDKVEHKVNKNFFIYLVKNFAVKEKLNVNGKTYIIHPVYADDLNFYKNN